MIKILSNLVSIVFKIIFWKFDFQHMDKKELQAKALGNLFDPKIHDRKYELKAVTYHQAALTREDRVWRARAYLDV